MTQSFELRPYQKTAVDQITEKFSGTRKRALLHLSTGAGKTAIMNTITAGFLNRGKKCITVVYRRLLVDQAARRLAQDCGVSTAIIMNRREFNGGSPVQFCSIDTLRARSIKPLADLIVIDEAHDAGADRYIEFLSHYPDACILGVTATPYPDKPLNYLFEEQDIVAPITHEELVSQGYLQKSRVFAVEKLDLSSVGTVAGEYNSSDLNEVMNRPKLNGDIIKTYQTKANGKSALVFASSVAHSIKLTEGFIAEGITAAHVDADTPEDLKAEYADMHESGEIKVITNYDIFATGIDWPWLECVIQARPTKSLVKHIQQLGRGTRNYPSKETFLVLDHANNVFEHGFIEDHHPAKLDGREKKARGASEPEVKHCQECFAVISKNVTTCPECGFVFEVAPTKIIKTAEAELVEIKRNAEAKETRERLKIAAGIEKIADMAWKCNLTPQFIWHRVKDTYGEAVAKKHLPWRRPLRPAEYDPLHPLHGTPAAQSPSNMEEYRRAVQNRNRSMDENRPEGLS